MKQKVELVKENQDIRRSNVGVYNLDEENMSFVILLRLVQTNTIKQTSLLPSKIKIIQN